MVYDNNKSCIRCKKQVVGNFQFALISVLIIEIFDARKMKIKLILFSLVLWSKDLHSISMTTESIILGKIRILLILIMLKISQYLLEYVIETTKFDQNHVIKIR